MVSRKKAFKAAAAAQTRTSATQSDCFVYKFMCMSLSMSLYHGRDIEEREKNPIG